MRTWLRTSVAKASVIAFAALAGATVVSAQSIASRVARVSNGSVRMAFTAEPGICGSGNSIWHNGGGGRGRGRTTWGNDWEKSRDVEWENDCSMGPARV